LHADAIARKLQESGGGGATEERTAGGLRPIPKLVEGTEVSTHCRHTAAALESPLVWAAAKPGPLDRGINTYMCSSGVFALRPNLPDVVAMQTRQPNLEGQGEIRLRRLIKEKLRMRPSRIIVGEVRQEESLDLLIALNSGLPGMCSVHANSAREAVIKLCTLPLLAGESVTAAFVVPTVATSIDLVVQLGIDPNGHRRTREIVALPGRVESGVVEVADIFTTRGNELVRAEGYPPHADRYARHGIDLPDLLADRRRRHSTE